MTIQADLLRAMIHPETCGHGRTWEQPCEACEDVWRKERVKDLHKRAARYGFRLVPIKLDENHNHLLLSRKNHP